MKIGTVIRESVKAYAHNFADLMLAFLLQALLRAMCLTPLLFLLSAELSCLAWLCVPMYVLIVLPARQNYALAMQDMLHGGRVFSPRLISTDRYLHKLGRGLIGLVKAAFWLALPVLMVVLMVQVSKGQGALASWVMSLWGITRRDGFTAMEWFQRFGSDVLNGLKHILMIVASTFLLPFIGCMVHCGTRHAVALEEKSLLKGTRLKLCVLWCLSLLVFVPFAAVFGVTLGSNLRLFISGFAEMFLSKSFSVPELGEKLYLIAAAFAVLVLPVVPLRQLVPAVAMHQRMLDKYEEIQTDAAA